MRAVVGLFESGSEARRAIDELAQLGFSPQSISVVTGLSTKSEIANDNPSAVFQRMNLADVGAVAASGPLATHERWGKRARLASMLERLGLSPDLATRFVRGIQRGGTLESMIVDDADAERVAGVMKKRYAARARAPAGAVGQAVAAKLGPERIGERLNRGHAFAEEERTIPVYREELSVGKREVERARVRLTTRVVEKPYDEKIVLREEHVDVDRRPADRLRRPEESQFKESQIEMAEIAEEAVGAKQTRLVEEIVIRKRVGERTAIVGDTLRSTQVDVRPLDATMDRGVAAGAAKRSRWVLILLPALPAALICALVIRSIASRRRRRVRGWACP